MGTKTDARQITDKAIDDRGTSDRLAQQRTGEDEEKRTRFGRTFASRQPPTERRRRQAGFPVRVPTACGTQFLIEAPLWVYVMWGSPVTDSAVRDEVAGARNIWERGAGIRFIPVYPQIDEATTRRVLRTQAESARGVAGGLSVEVGSEVTIQRRLSNSGHWQALRWFHHEQSGGEGIALVFAQSSVVPALTDPSYPLVVISRVSFEDEWRRQCPAGKVAAHEIGHVLLGEGHSTAYSREEARQSGRRAIRSPLMNPNWCDVRIEQSDCRYARNKARRIPGAYMFGDSPTGDR